MSIYHVARLTGLSKSTVSRVINGESGVSPETAKNVRRAMSRLGYTPSPNRPGPKPRRPLARDAAQGLSGVRHGCVAIVNVLRSTDLLDHPYFHRLLAVLRRELGALGLNLVLDELSPTELPLAVREQRVDGVLLTGRSPAPEIVQRLSGVPAVWMSAGHPGSLLIDHVMADNTSIGVLAAQYLLGTGRRRVAYMNCEPAGNSTAMREQAFVQVCRAANVPVDRYVDAALEPRPDDWVQEAVVDRLSRLIDAMLAKPSVPDAMFFPYDQHAAAAHRLLAARGIRTGPPGANADIVLVSVGNEEPYLQSMAARTATIDPNPDEMGRWAVERLLARLADPARPPVRVMVAPILVPPRPERRRAPAPAA